VRKSRFNEEQIITILKDSEAGVETGELRPAARDHQSKLLSLEVAVRRAGAERGQAAETAAGREPATEACRSGADPGQSGAEGGVGKKVVSPQMRREAVLVMQLEVKVSQRRACGLMEMDRGTCRYRRRRMEGRYVLTPTTVR
jgi:hypothetical protein